MPREPDDFDDEFDLDAYAAADGFEPVQRSRAVRWTAILVVASFALAGLSSLTNFW